MIYTRWIIPTYIRPAPQRESLINAFYCMKTKFEDKLKGYQNLLLNEYLIRYTLYFSATAHKTLFLKITRLNN